MNPLIGITCGKKTLSGNGGGFYGIKAGYLQVVSEAGGIPVVVYPGLEKEMDSILPRLDGVLIPGGGDVNPRFYGDAPSEDDEERDLWEIALARACLKEGIPVLGICRGEQVLNVAAGGSLYQDIPAHQGVEHPVQVTPESLLHCLTGKNGFLVNSRHHQAVKDVAPGWVVSARSGDGTIEAIEYPEHFFALGVQWHPEDLARDRDEHRILITALVEAARNKMQRLTTMGGRHATTSP